MEDAVSPLAPGPAARILVRPFQVFFRLESASGILLLAAALAALVWANSPAADSYFRLWATVGTVALGELIITKPLLLWINDGLMAIFFFVVGLEIKREVLVGEVAQARHAALPIAAAAGGMAVPAALYAALNAGGAGAAGWGVPMAIDIAFALGVLALLGDRVPLALKIFVTAVAIVDDLGAVLVIALFYTERLSLAMLLIGNGVLVVLVLLNRCAAPGRTPSSELRGDARAADEPRDRSRSLPGQAGGPAGLRVARGQGRHRGDAGCGRLAPDLGGEPPVRHRHHHVAVHREPRLRRRSRPARRRQGGDPLRLAGLRTGRRSRPPAGARASLLPRVGLRRNDVLYSK